MLKFITDKYSSLTRKDLKLFNVYQHTNSKVKNYSFNKKKKNPLR